MFVHTKTDEVNGGKNACSHTNTCIDYICCTTVFNELIIVMGKYLCFFLILTFIQIQSITNMLFLVKGHMENVCDRKLNLMKNSVMRVMHGHIVWLLI